MRLRSRRLLALALAATLVGAACGGSGDGSILGNVPTATLPDPLPELLILDGGPAASAQGRSYTVEPGDSLSLIAERFGTTAQALAEANGIEDPRRLEVGQVLVIPEGPAEEQPTEEPPPVTEEPPATPSPEAEKTYEVASGDVAALIAERFGVTVEELAAANNTTIDDLRSLSVGDVLVIPTPSPTATPGP